MADAPKKGFFKRIVNIRDWTNFDEVMFHSRNVVRAYKAIYKPEPGTGRPETFDEATRRLGLDEAAIKKKKNFFLLYFITYAIFGVGLFIYGIYLVKVSATFLAILLSFLLSALMFVYAMREHFWFMQLSKRKLGCNKKEWIAFIFRRAQNEKY